MNTTELPQVTRHSIDSFPGWERVLFFVRAPGYESRPTINSWVWNAVEHYQTSHPELPRTKDGYLHGHVNGCAPDEILVSKAIR